MQLCGEERKAFIVEEMNKLRNLQAEEREREAGLQAGEREEERKARLQAEEREKKKPTYRPKKQLPDYKRKRMRQARLKIEELKVQVEIEKICAQADVKTVGGAAEGTTGICTDQVKPNLPRLPAFVDRKDDLDSWLLCFERFANNKWMAKGELVYLLVCTTDW